MFTAHPTFSLPLPVNQALAEAACGRPAPAFESHRPPPITLRSEFDQSVAAIANGRDAIDRFNAALISVARGAWADRWTELTPSPVVLSTWVGYDTDGRTDIGWWDTLRLRLEMKRLQLARLHAQVVRPAQRRCAGANGWPRRGMRWTGRSSCARTSRNRPRSRPSRMRWSASRETALTSPAPLLPLFRSAIAKAEDHDKLALTVARAGLVSHGMALAHTHTRLNAAQIHNVVRQRLGIADPPEDPSRRRALFAAINAALDTVKPEPVDFGALIGEQASAAKLMMTVAQIVKHVDSSVPVRFLIAETETGYTLLAALWLARLFGIEQHVEISPLFETAEALERGATVLEEALRSPHYRDYLKQTGKLALQFGYSDSGRYVGQLAASYLIERLRLKIGQTLEHHGVTGVEVILFDTHGESIGRGAHPGLPGRPAEISVAHRVPAGARTGGAAGARGSGVPGRRRVSAVRHAGTGAGDDHPDRRTDLSSGGRSDRGPGLCRSRLRRRFLRHHPQRHGRAGRGRGICRVAWRVRSVAAGPHRIAPRGTAVGRHGGRRPHPPSAANCGRSRTTRSCNRSAGARTRLQGIGAAAARHPETFTELRQNSRRFKRAMDLASHALAHSDIEVLRAVIATLDPGTWLDRAAHTRRPGRREALVSVAKALERLDIWAAAQSMFRRISADHLALRVTWPDVPHMANREILLHALRLALIHRIWLLATEIPDFSPRHGVTRLALEAAILRLDIDASLNDAGGDISVDRGPGRGLRLRRAGAEAPHRGLCAGARGDFRPDAAAVRHGAGDRDGGDA